ncbi:MAG: DUF359 domain-containing protein [Candidatus Aenigmatarchaeota archaeon]
MYLLPKAMRKEMRKPLGRVFDNTKKLVNYVKNAHFRKLVAIGDVCTRSLLDNCITPDMSIIDKKTRRTRIRWSPAIIGDFLKAINKPATISDGLMKTVKEAFDKGGKSIIVVKGEEDLAALPAIKYCPVNSIVVYGIWYKGVVVVKADKKIKARIEKIFSRMVTL